MKYLLPFDLINEAKQVGNLYHWTTNIYTLTEILKNDCIKSSYPYISFSRNKRLNFGNRPIRITFDGNRMSDKFKFEPYLHMRDLEFKSEAEERIKCKSFVGINGIIKYITDIEIRISKLKKPFFQSDMLELKSNIDTLNELIPQIKIKIK